MGGSEATASETEAGNARSTCPGTCCVLAHDTVMCLLPPSPPEEPLLGGVSPSLPRFFIPWMKSDMSLCEGTEPHAVPASASPQLTGGN